jgi:hypothetical protein
MIERTEIHMGHPNVSSTEIYQIRYGMGIWLLQENAGLTYNEARTYLSGMRNESDDQLAEALNVKKSTVYCLRASARKKLDGKLLDDILMGYTPMAMETCSPVKVPFF